MRIVRLLVMAETSFLVHDVLQLARGCRSLPPPGGGRGMKFRKPFEAENKKDHARQISGAENKYAHPLGL
jgi:hypothetical protein